MNPPSRRTLDPTVTGGGVRVSTVATPPIQSGSRAGSNSTAATRSGGAFTSWLAVTSKLIGRLLSRGGVGTRVAAFGERRQPRQVVLPAGLVDRDVVGRQPAVGEGHVRGRSVLDQVDLYR